MGLFAGSGVGKSVLLGMMARYTEADVIVVGLIKKGFGFFKIFVPSGVPVVLLFIVTPIEIISFLSRPISLGMRLFANMLGGHVALKVFAGFVPALASAIQANTESGTAAGWQELGNGVYRYTSTTNLATVTSPIAVAYEPSLTHRVSIAIDLSGAARELAPDNPFKDFVPAGGTLVSLLIPLRRAQPEAAV